MAGIGLVDVCEFLCNHSADPDVSDRRGRTPADECAAATDRNHNNPDSERRFHRIAHILATCSASHQEHGGKSPTRQNGQAGSDEKDEKKTSFIKRVIL